MSVQWHRVDYPTAPLGHGLTARVGNRTWLAYETDNGKWVLEGTSPPSPPIVVENFTEARRMTRSTRKRNGAGTGAFLASLIGAVSGALIGPPFALLGSVAGGGVGGWVAARADRKRRGAAGGAIGGTLGPIGAAVGGYVAGRKPDRDFRKRRGKKNPRRYGPEEWAEFVLEGLAAAEDGRAEVTPELQQAADDFEYAVDEALDECFARYEPHGDTERLYADPGTAADIYFTLTGAGVGIWDGRWDDIYPDASRRQWQRITTCLREHLQEPYEILETELIDAVYRNDNPTRRLEQRLARRTSE